MGVGPQGGVHVLLGAVLAHDESQRDAEGGAELRGHGVRWAGDRRAVPDRDPGQPEFDLRDVAPLQVVVLLEVADGFDRRSGGPDRGVHPEHCVADPAAALLEFMTRGIELLARDRALCEIVGRPSLQQPAVRAGIDRLCEVVEMLTDRARRQDLIRQDITGQDIVLLLAGVHQTAAPLADTQPQLWRRYLALTFDGIRTQRPQPLPHPAPHRFKLTPDSMLADNSKAR